MIGVPGFGSIWIIRFNPRPHTTGDKTVFPQWSEWAGILFHGFACRCSRGQRQGHVADFGGGTVEDGIDPGGCCDTFGCCHHGYVNSPQARGNGHDLVAVLLEKWRGDALLGQSGGCGGGKRCRVGTGGGNGRLRLRLRCFFGGLPVLFDLPQAGGFRVDQSLAFRFLGLLELAATGFDLGTLGGKGFLLFPLGGGCLFCLPC
jgi:hypothetical protein